MFHRNSTTTAITTHGRTRRALGAVSISTLLVVNLACGAQPAVPAGQAAPVAAVGGSDKHLELRATEIADRTTERRVHATHGSDRHLGINAELAAAARLRATHGSDRHLGTIAELAAATRPRATHGSDRHLVMLASDGLGRTDADAQR